MNDFVKSIVKLARKYRASEQDALFESCYLKIVQYRKQIRKAMSPPPLTRNEFIEKSIQIWGENKFDYSKVQYVKNTDKVLLKCVEHNKWF